MTTNTNQTEAKARKADEIEATAEYFVAYYERASKEEWDSGNKMMADFYSGQASAYRHIVSLFRGQ